MEAKDVLIMQFNGVKSGLDRVLDSLTQAEIAWQPASGCNSIGLILFHMARTDDGFLLGAMLGGTPLWESRKWFAKLNLPATESGHQYTVEQVNAFSAPPKQDLVAYGDAARAAVVECIRGLTAEDLARVVKTPVMGDVQLQTFLAAMAGHAYTHVGEISYLRGMQRGLDK
jgi:uncharacterized damage-inducible protein DinB